MNAVSIAPSQPQPSRFMAVCLPRLSTDRIRRERLGRSWRSDARPEEEGPSPALSRNPPGLSGPARGRPAARVGTDVPLDSTKAPLAPLALYGHSANTNRIVAVCDRAALLGLHFGIGLSEARARFPDLDLLEADPAADDRLLDAVADWCDRYTPLVALDPPHGLVLDISGCAHLFGGEKSLMSDLLARLFDQGFAAHAAIASHPGTALALATGRPASIRVAEGDEVAAIEALSVRALRLDNTLSATLERLGLKTVATLLPLPRQSLARRFGETLLDRLDEAAGRSSKPISPRLAVPALIAERRFAQPISLIEDIERIVAHLSARLKTDLERRGEGARELQLALFRVDGRVDRVSVGSSRPIREPKRMSALFRERIKGFGEELDCGFGYDLVKLSVLKAESLIDIQEDLAGEQAGDDDLRALLDRIGARLGETSVHGIQPVESHRPERAEKAVPVAQFGKEARSTLMKPHNPRPLRLLGTPEQVETVAEVPEGAPMRFRWRKALHTVRRVEGPERIASEWWRTDCGDCRDYYRIEDEEGRRYWLFREGSYDADRPAWYLHGVFA